jgi:hypothetical protein
MKPLWAKSARATLVAAVGAVAVSCRPAEVAEAELSQAPRMLEVQLGRDNTLLPDRWFHPVEEYLANASINPGRRALDPAEMALARQVLAAASLELDAIQRDCSRAQMDVAQRYVTEGKAERYIAGESDLSKGAFAAVVVAAFDESGPWLVRIPEQDLPDFATWRAASNEIQGFALDRIRRLASGDRGDRELADVTPPSPVPTQ